MQAELVVFDMAGTTVHDGDAVHRCLHDALAKMGVETTRTEINAVMGIAKPLAIRAILEDKRNSSTLVTNGGSLDEMVERTHRLFVAQMSGFYQTSPDVREIAGARQVFETLRAAGVKVALDTGFSRAIADSILARLGWDDPDVLNTTVTSDEVERGRPYPDMIFRAMELTGVTDVKRVAKVGDTPSDLQEGTSAGCGMVVGVTQGSHTRAELQGEPHTHLVETVADIPALLSGVSA